MYSCLLFILSSEKTMKKKHTCEYDWLSLEGTAKGHIEDETNGPKMHYEYDEWNVFVYVLTCCVTVHSLEMCFAIFRLAVDSQYFIYVYRVLFIGEKDHCY